MNMKKYILPFLCALLAGGLTTGCSDSANAVSEGELVTVNIIPGLQTSISPASGADAVTRATQPLTPGMENGIRNIWIVQYGPDGVIYPEITKYYDISSAGLLEIPGGLPVQLRTASNTTVCLITNVGEDIADFIDNWIPDNLNNFNRSKIKMDIHSLSNEPGGSDGKVGQLNNVFMFGHYQGAITNETTNISAILGRLGVRINVVVTNNTGTNLSGVKISLKRIPLRMYLSPLKVETLANEDYTDYYEYISALGNGVTAERFYYIGEDYMPDESNITTLEFTHGGTARSVSIRLGGDPSVPDEIRDYTLLRNSNYTYNIELRDISEQP